MDDGVEQQTQRVYENMAFLALDLLARIIAMRIDAGPPLYGDFDVVWVILAAPRPRALLIAENLCLRQQLGGAAASAGPEASSTAIG
jgi:hypothetical protein